MAGPPKLSDLCPRQPRRQVQIEESVDNHEELLTTEPPGTKGLAQDLEEASSDKGYGSDTSCAPGLEDICVSGYFFSDFFRGSR